MLRVRMTEARPGMVLALPLRHPKRAGTLLLKAGTMIDRRLLTRLGEIGVREFWIRYPNLDFVAMHAKSEIIAAHSDMTATVAQALNPVMTDSHAHLDFSDCMRSVTSLVEQLVASPRAAVYIEEVLAGEEGGSRHAANVSFLSILMGLKLDEYLINQRSRLTSAHARDVTNLGLGAMLHDIGMLRLEQSALDHWNRTQDETDPRWREHVLIGHETVRSEIGPAAAGVVLHHHQSYDGSGFPIRRLPDGSIAPPAGEAVHVFARIAAVADMFDRIRFNGEYFGVQGPDPIPRPRALRLMMEQDIAEKLDPVVLQSLFRVVPPYPPGDVVRLSTGEQAVVVDWTPLDPCRPTVQPIDLEAGLAGDIPAGDPINLRVDREILIVEAEKQDVTRDNFELSKDGAPRSASTLPNAKSPGIATPGPLS